MTFLGATNVVASQPPERQLTGTPTTHADKLHSVMQDEVLQVDGNSSSVRYYLISGS